MNAPFLEKLLVLEVSSLIIKFNLQFIQIYQFFQVKCVKSCLSSTFNHQSLDAVAHIFTINPGGDNLYTADQICRMVEFLIDNIFVKFGGCLFRQVIGIPMGMNCAPLPADLFLYSYESEFLDNMIRGGHRKLARSFNLCYRYIDNLIVFNRSLGIMSKRFTPPN